MNAPARLKPKLPAGYHDATAWRRASPERTNDLINTRLVAGESFAVFTCEATDEDGKRAALLTFVRGAV